MICFGRKLLLTLTAAVSVLLVGSTIPAAGAHSDPVIINSLDETGRYLELGDADVDRSIDAANADGIAFAWLDQGGDSRVAQSLADDYLEDLEEIGSRYRTVLVLTSEGFAAASSGFDNTEIGAALDASFDSFAAGSAARGIEQFNDTLSGFLVGSSTGTTLPSGDAGTDTGSSSSSGGGIGFGTIVLGIAVIGGGFLLFTRMRNGRKQRRQAAIDMEEDRAEIKEQLKNNADRVIGLGDRVIASGDHGMIARYEEASATYQDVSQSVDGAETAAEIDALDDRIDHAEWQFEAIEAELGGRPIPPSPAELEAKAEAEMPPPPAGSAAGNRDRTGRSAEDRSVVTSPRTGRSYPATGSTRTRTGRPVGGRRGGIGGGRQGGLGGALGSILGGIVLNGGLGGGRSRRSQRRTGGMGGGLGDIFGGGTSSRRSGGTGGLGGPGGGVLRRGGSGSSRRAPRRTTRSNSRSSGSRGRSTRGRSRGRGGRSF